MLQDHQENLVMDLLVGYYLQQQFLVCFYLCLHLNHLYFHLYFLDLLYYYFFHHLHQL